MKLDDNPARKTVPIVTSTADAPASEEGGDSELVSLYQAHKKIYPRSVSGLFSKWRWGLVWLTQLVFYGLAWLQWNDRQAVLFDLEARRFYIFGLVLYPQDLIYLSALLMVSALALRLPALSLPLGHSDDAYRYLWDGLVQTQGHSPYAGPPDAPAYASVAATYPELHTRINHRHLPTIYPPLAELSFRLQAALTMQAPWTLAAALRSWKAWMLAADLLVLLTDTAGLYTSDPRTDPSAQLIARVPADDPLLAVSAGASGSNRGSGGMASKLAAARTASFSGVQIGRASCRERVSSPV